MDMEIYREAVASADIAFDNEQFDKALPLYDKALGEVPNDVYALSKAGAACVSLERYEDSFGYFERALQADPENGDNLFNMANAYFFSGDIAKAMQFYTKAQQKECSEDVKARIFYQLAMMCSLKGDLQAALVNFQKYEDADQTGEAALDTELLSEKVEIYLRLEDYENAAKIALQWVSLAPSDLRANMVYFNVLMAAEDYPHALEALDAADKYAASDAAAQYAVDVSRASYYAAVAGTEYDPGDFNDKAYELLNRLIVSEYGTPDDKNELVLALGELCIKLGKVDEAIELMSIMTEEPSYQQGERRSGSEHTADPAEVDAMLAQDLQEMDARLASGEIDENIGEYASMNFDAAGKTVREYPEEALGVPETEQPELPTFAEEKQMEMAKALAEEDHTERSRDLRDKVNYLLLSCYAYKEDFEKALEYSRIVKSNPDNLYYAFFGRYSEAFCMMQLAKRGGSVSREEADRRYQEVIAFFRNEMLKADEGSAYALLFRTRMYAELGKYEKAEELSGLMTAADQTALLEYIEQCKKDNGDA